MEYNDLIKNRYSCRSFSDKKVEKEKLRQIITCGILAPTARNMQPQKIMVLTSKEDLAKLKECSKYGWNAPVCFILCYDKEKTYKRACDSKDFGDIDVSIMATYMMLEIYNLGLATTWVGNFDPLKLKSIYHIPDCYEPVALLPVGYPSDSSIPSSSHYIRKEMSEILF